MNHLFAHGSIHEAIERKSRQIEEAPTDALLFFERGMLYQKHDETGPALSDFHRALQLEPAYHICRLPLAELYLKKGRPRKALYHINYLLEREPDNPFAYEARASVYSAMGWDARAVADLRRLIALKNGEAIRPEDFLRLSEAILRATPGKHDEAIEVLESGLRRLGNIISIQERIISAELENGQCTAALERIEQILATPVNREKWLAKKAQALEKNGRPEEAYAVYRQITGTGRSSHAAHGPLPNTANAIPAIPYSAPASAMLAVTRGPYLQMGTPGSMIVKWRTDAATDSKLWYGPGPANLDMSVAAGGAQTNHEITVTGLSANTRYYYAIGHEAGILAGGDADHFFQTSPPAGAVQTVRAWVLGDCGTGNSNARAVRDGYYNYIGNAFTDLILLLGDNAYDSGTDQEYQMALFENMYEGKLIQSVLWPTIGNHDITIGNSASQLDPYFSIFSLPRNGEAGGLASGTEAYYSFDYANIHFVVLDSEYGSGRDPGSPMFTWLDNDLGATAQDWTIVYWHHPPYSKGSHDSDSESALEEMRQNALPILEAHSVDLVLAGHSHSYERSYLLHGHYGASNTLQPSMIVDNGNGRADGDGAYEKITGGPALPEGAVYVVAGSSGKTSGGSLNHPVMYFSVNTLGSLSLEITGAQLDLKFIGVNGTVLDYFTMQKSMPLGAPPTVSVSSPADGAHYSSPQLIALEAQAGDTDGTIAEVAFLIDGSTVGTDNTAPYAFDWAIPADGNYSIQARARDNDGNYTTSSPVNITVGNLQACSRVSSSSDDAEEKSNGSVSLTSSDLELVYDGSNQTIGMRFNNLNIPPGATITGAHIQFTVDEARNNNPCNLSIYGQASDNPPTFSGSSNSISNRPRTTASVAWSPPNWPSVGNAGPAQQTPDLSPIVQEIVNRNGYGAGNAIVILINGSGRRVAESFNGSSSQAPELCVEYSIIPQDCPALSANIGDPCDDNDNTTANDMVGTDCICAGTPTACFGIGDGDGDGICSNVDCDDNNAAVTSVDNDRDGVCADVDCDDNDALAGSNANDADCDGIATAQDCDDDDPFIGSNANDNDCDGIATAQDCDDNDPLTGSNADDADCDGVSTAQDCDDNDPLAGNIANDADCDGIATAQDCDDGDPLIGSNANDNDCDGIATAQDCDDNDPLIGSNANDNDCDGIATAQDCDDGNPLIGSNANDADCDGIATTQDCDDNDPLIGSIDNDADCDGIATAQDCDDNDPLIGSNDNDADCDGIATAQDCDDGDPLIGSNANDADCDGIPTAQDCDDGDPFAGNIANDADCDGIPTAQDCDDNDPLIGSSADDADCDGVATAQDCDDNDPLIGSNANDADCDGIATAQDCDDDDPFTGSNANDNDCDGIATAQDCDDNDPFTGSNADDADCDGIATAQDCDDGDPLIGSNANDNDCDGIATAQDCDDNDPLIGSNANDADCDGVATAQDCDDGDPLIGSNANDADCDGIATAQDCDDDNPLAGNIANDADCDGLPTAQDCDDTDYTIAYRPGDSCDDGDANTSGDIIQPDCTCHGNPALYSVCSRISAGSDDAEQRSNGSVDLSSSDLELVYDGSNQTIGLRFNNLNIPQGAAIATAYLQFTVDETRNNNPCNLAIYGQDSDNASTFAGSNNNVTSRPRTAATVSWQPPQWTSVGSAGAAQQSPGLAPIIQEIVGRSGYSAGNSIVILIEGTGRRVAESFNGSPARAAELCIEYSVIPPDCPALSANIGDLCDDGNGATIDDTVNADCDCMGILNSCPGTGDDDGDGICNDVDCDDNDPYITLQVGSPCEDGDPNTFGEAIQADCSCGGGNSTPLLACSRVNSSADDAEERSSGGVSLTGSDLELVNDGNRGDQSVGMRFSGLNIPPGALIANAYVQFTVDETRNDNPCILTIEGQASDNAGAFSSSNYNVSSRPRTLASVNWAPPEWASTGAGGPGQRTPDISAIIQEIVNRGGYAQASSIAIIIEGSGRRVARSYNGSSSGAPELCVEYYGPQPAPRPGPPNADPMPGNLPSKASEDQAAGSIKLFPNPANDELKIAFTSAGEGRVQVHARNINGQEAILAEFAVGFGHNTIVLDCHSLPAGIYFLQLQAAGDMRSARFIIQK